MPSAMNVSQADPELDQIRDARKYAAALRGQSDKNIQSNSQGRMVGPYWINYDDRGDHLKNIVGAGIDYFGGQQERSIQQARQQAEQEQFANIPKTVEEMGPWAAKFAPTSEIGQTINKHILTKSINAPFEAQERSAKLADEKRQQDDYGRMLESLYPIQQMAPTRLGGQESGIGAPDQPGFVGDPTKIEADIARIPDPTQRAAALEQFQAQMRPVATRNIPDYLMLGGSKTGQKVAPLLAAASRQQVTEQGRNTRQDDQQAAVLEKTLAGLQNGNQDLQREILQQKLDANKEKAEGAKTTKQADAQNAYDYLEQVRRNVNELYDPATKSLTPGTSSVFGTLEQYRPSLIMSETSSNKLAALNSLKDQLTMTNLTEAKRRVGQSFGSMQVKEWDKFLNQLTSLDRSLGEAQAAKNLGEVLKFIDENQAILQVALGGTPNTQPPSAAVIPVGVDPEDWKHLKPEERALWQ